MFSSQKEFIDAYVTNFSTGVYSRQINTCVNKFRTAKKKTTKDDYTYILFTTYLQLFENFQIFLLVLFHNQGIDNIFIPNQELAKRFNEIFKQGDDNSTFENKCLFKLALEKMIGGFCGKHFSEYNKFVHEALGDYHNHKHLLNSFKHGFRIHSRGGQTVYIGVDASMYKIMETDVSLVYYIKEGNQVSEISHAFSMDYVALKSQFIINIIENFKKIYLGNIKTTIIYTTPDSPKNRSKNTQKTPIYKIETL